MCVMTAASGSGLVQFAVFQSYMEEGCRAFVDGPLLMCRYPGWVTELNDSELMGRLDGSAYGLDNLLYSADACERFKPLSPLLYWHGSMRYTLPTRL